MTPFELGAQVRLILDFKAWKSGFYEPMNPLLRLFALILLLSAASVHAADLDTVITAVRLADDERVAATLARDLDALKAIYSDEMHYAHSSGKIDSKTSQLEGIATGIYKYTKFDYKERTFIPIAPTVVLMKGAANLALTRLNGEKILLDINYLGVWRLEGGKWKFMAWQAAKNVPLTVLP